MGGDRTVINDALPVLYQMCETIYFAGQVGYASKMKAMHQISAAIHHTSSFEVVCMGLYCGIDSKVSPSEQYTPHFC